MEEYPDVFEAALLVVYGKIEDLVVDLKPEETMHILRELEYPCLTEYTEPSGVVRSSTPTITVCPPEL